MRLRQILGFALGAFASAVALGASSGCGGGFTSPDLFSTSWSDDHGAGVERVRARLAGRRAEPQANAVVGVVDTGHLVGLSLDSAAPAWTFAHMIEARPLLAGDVVVCAGAGELFALDAAHGKLLWSRPTGGLPLYAAGDDGKVTVVILGRAGGRGSTLLAISRDGSVVRQTETPEVLGAPAVMGGLAFVPWERQYVSVVDLSGGEELGRILFRQPVSHAWVFDGSAFFGDDTSIFRFDARTAESARGRATHLALPPEHLPGRVALFPPAPRAVPLMANAYDEARLFARATGGEGTIGLAGDHLYASYFRVLMAFDPTGRAAGKGGALAWVRRVDANVLGGAAGRTSFAACDARGRISVYDASSGALHGARDLGQPVRACVVQLDAYEPQGEAEAPLERKEQLRAILTDRDAQLVPVQKSLLDAVVRDPSDDATALLVELATDPRTAPEVASAAEAKIAERKNGSAALLRALGHQYDYLRDILRPPPVAAIAPALAASRDESAAAALVPHLFDPADSDEDIRAAARALETLAGPSEIPALAHFFAAYRASSENDVLLDAVASAATAVLAKGTDEQKYIIAAAATDERTSTYLRPLLAAMLPKTVTVPKP